MKRSFLLSTFLALSGIISPVLSQADKKDVEEAILDAANKPSNSEFRRRALHSIATIGNYLYIDSGEVSVTINGTAQKSKAVTNTLAVPLDKAWTGASFIDQIKTIDHKGNPVNKVFTLWADTAKGRILSWGGDGPYGDKNGAKNRSLWELQPQSSGLGTWLKRAPNNPDVFKKILRASGGVSTVCGGKAYMLGGFVSEYTDDQIAKGVELASPGLLTYDLATGDWNNATVPAEYSSTMRDGDAHCIPFGGAGGLIVFIGGATYELTKPFDNSNSLLPMSTITFYDPAAKAWYQQTTTGETPIAGYCFAVQEPWGRMGPMRCCVVYGGYNRGISGDALSDTWVLTIPGFHWTKATVPGSTPRMWHKCANVGGRQMISVGGFDQNDGGFDKTVDPWTQGIGVLDMTTLSWQNGFDPNTSAYDSPDAIKSWYAAGGQAQVQWKSEPLKALLLNGTNPGNPGNPQDPPPAAGAPVGAIVGGVVGGLGLAAIIATLTIYYLRRRRRQQLAPELDNQPELRHSHAHDQEAAKWKPAELAPPEPPGELSGEPVIHGPGGHSAGGYRQVHSELPGS